MPIGLLISALLLFKKQVGEFLATRLNVLRHVRDAMAEIKTNKNNKQMLKTEIVLNVIGSETKYYSMLKTYLQM